MDYNSEFPILMQMDFFNHAGVAPITHRAAVALQEYALEASTFAYVKDKWYPRISQVKQAIAKLINARSEHEIAFVPNTSTGLSLVANGLDWHEGDNVIIARGGDETKKITLLREHFAAAPDGSLMALMTNAQIDAAMASAAPAADTTGE